MMGELTTELGGRLAENLEGFKLIKSKKLLHRDLDVGWHRIVLKTIPTSNSEKAKLVAHAQIRHEQLESLYLAHHPFMNSRDAKDHPTIAENCDHLIAEESLTSSFATTSEGVRQFVENYSKALKSDVLPWLEKYSSEQSLYEGLSDEDPMRWITSDRLTRYPVLMSILAQRGEWNEFERIAKEFADYCEQPHAQVYKPMVESVVSGLRSVRVT